LSFDTFLTKPLDVRGVLGPCGDSGASVSFAQAVPPRLREVPIRGAELTRSMPLLLSMESLRKPVPIALPELLTLAESLKAPPEGAKSVAPVLEPGLPGTFGDLGRDPTEIEGRRASRRELEWLRRKFPRQKLDAELPMLLTAAGALPGGDAVVDIKLATVKLEMD